MDGLPISQYTPRVCLDHAVHCVCMDQTKVDGRALSS